jgi:glycosyltransferase involved in cell wall biosynthesis
VRSVPKARLPAAPRIALAIESSGPGGAEQVVLRLAQALAARGARAIVATQRPGWLTERAERAGAEVWLAPQRPGLDPAWLVRFARRLRRERVDLVHAHEFAMGLFGGVAARAAGVPVVATLHGRQWLAGRALRRRAWRLSARAGVRHVAVSTDLADWLAGATGLPRAAIEVVENGIEIAPERGAAEIAALRADVRGELGLAADAPLLVAVGNLYPVKDHATLLRALPALPDAHLAIAGRGDERDALAAQADALGVAGRLHLVGLRDDVARWLAAADLFVHPSRSEELPLAVLEAMAAGCAIVATRVGGVPDAVVDGESGLLVEAGDATALAGAVGALLADAEWRRALGRAARARVVARFAVERMVERYCALYGWEGAGVAGEPCIAPA